MMREVLQERPASMRVNRVLGHIKGALPGPTLVVVGGMHGNEPSGVQALQTLLEELDGQEDRFSGELYALAGNLRALEEGKRFIDYDLNRMWKMGADMRSLGKVPTAYEEKEMLELHELVQQISENRKGPLIFLDLHTTSSESAPFLLCGDTLRNRDFIAKIPVPKILGLDEQLNGPFLSYVNAQGHISIVFEAGQHTSPESYKNHLALLKVMLVEAGCVGKDQLGPHQENLNRLDSQAGKDLQSFFEVRHRFGIKTAPEFKMKPGYYNFRPITDNELLAHYRNFPVFAPLAGRIFMPLYQQQGDDGFFIVRKIPARRIRRSAFLRRLGFHKVLPIFPGIRRHPKYENMLLVNPRYFRRWGPSVLYVLGYRRMTREHGSLVFIKRPYDLKGPRATDTLSR